MKKNLAVYFEVKKLLNKHFGENLIYTEEDESYYVNITGSNLWIAYEFNELIVGFGMNHTHFSEDYDNLKEGVVQLRDFLINKIQTTNYIKGNYIFKTTVDIIFPDSRLKNIGKSSILFYPYWKKTYIEFKISEALLLRDVVEDDFQNVLILVDNNFTDN